MLNPPFTRCLIAAFFLAAAAWNPRADSCDPILTFADGKESLRQIFISPGGGDDSGDGSRQNPFQTLPRALENVRPGDAIRLLPGTYPAGHFIEDIAGTEDNPIWLGGVPGEERPLIYGGSTALHLVCARYLVLENLEVSGAAANGINCDDGGDYANPEAARRLVFRNLFIHDIGTGGNNDGLKLSGVNDYYVLDCEFARMSAGGSAIDHVGCHGGLIARCTFTDAGSNSIQCKGGSENIDIRWNKFIRGGSRAINIGGSTGFEFFRPPLSAAEPNFESRNIRVLANLFIGSDAPVAFVGTVDSLVANNTIIEPSRWVLRILQETVSTPAYEFLPSGQNHFLNNLVYYSRADLRTHANIGPDTAPETFTFANNLWYAFDQPAQSQPSLPVPEVDGIAGENPKFQNAGAGDYTPRDGSPAAGSGQPIAELKADLLERCYANPPSIGAFEASPPEPPQADTDQDGMPDDWEILHSLDPTDASDAVADLDGDNFPNLSEFLAGTDPGDAESVFHILPPALAGNDFHFQYPTQPGRNYQVHRRPFEASTWNPAESTTATGQTQTYSETISGKGALFQLTLQPAFPP